MSLDTGSVDHTCCNLCDSRNPTLGPVDGEGWFSSTKKMSGQYIHYIKSYHWKGEGGVPGHCIIDMYVMYVLYVY